MVTVLVALVTVLWAENPAAFVAGAGSARIAAYVAVANQFIRGAWRPR